MQRPVPDVAQVASSTITRTMGDDHAIAMRLDDDDAATGSQLAPASRPWAEPKRPRPSIARADTGDPVTTRNPPDAAGTMVAAPAPGAPSRRGADQSPPGASLVNAGCMPPPNGAVSNASPITPFRSIAKLAASPSPAEANLARVTHRTGVPVIRHARIAPSTEPQATAARPLGDPALASESRATRDSTDGFDGIRPPRIRTASRALDPVRPLRLLRHVTIASRPAEAIDGG